MERLQKVIANSGYCSRRKAEELILNNEVSVNGVIVNKLGTKVDSNDTIEINGKMLNKQTDKVYYMLNKPRGVISSAEDEKNRKTVVDLIDTDQRIYPIGRLDYDTTGLILLTNDGELTNMLIHPSYEVPKGYLAKLKGIIDKTIEDYQEEYEIDRKVLLPGESNINLLKRKRAINKEE